MELVGCSIRAEMENAFACDVALKAFVECIFTKMKWYHVDILSSTIFHCIVLVSFFAIQTSILELAVKKLYWRKRHIRSNHRKPISHHQTRILNSKSSNKTVPDRGWTEENYSQEREKQNSFLYSPSVLCLVWLQWRVQIDSKSCFKSGNIINHRQAVRTIIKLCLAIG